MKCEWTLWCGTKTERKAIRVLERFRAATGLTYDDISIEYDVDIPGYSIFFEVELVEPRWVDAVVNCIEIGQRVSETWTIFGSIAKSGRLSASSTEVTVPGVELCEWELERPNKNRGILDDCESVSQDISEQKHSSPRCSAGSPHENAGDHLPDAAGTPPG